MTINASHLEKAVALGAARANHDKLQGITEPYPDADGRSAHDNYIKIVGDKPDYNSDAGYDDLYAIDDAYERGYYDAWDDEDVENER